MKMPSIPSAPRDKMGGIPASMPKAPVDRGYSGIPSAMPKKGK